LTFDLKFGPRITREIDNIPSFFDFLELVVSCSHRSSSDWQSGWNAYCEKRGQLTC